MPLPAKLRILHIEDDALDAEMVRERIAAAGIQAEIICIQSEPELADYLTTNQFDLILADYNLPGFDGLAALDMARKKAPDVPFIFVSGAIGEDVAIETLKAGATDYVLKGRLERLVPAIRRALREVEERAIRQRFEATIREQAALLDLAQDAILVWNLDGRIRFWSKGAERLYGWTLEEVAGKTVSERLFQDAGAFESTKEVLLRTGDWKGDSQHLTKDGRIVVVSSRWTLLRDSAGVPTAVLSINTDITEKKQLEAQFLRAQRMEGIGTLASGVAHDLNNVLAPILMSCQMLRSGVSQEDARAMLDTVEKSAKRGADIVRQLITFARGTEGQRVLIDPRHLIHDIVNMARSTFPKGISIRIQVKPDLWTIDGEPTQLHQVLLNLAVNARDAMPNGGVLTFSAENVRISEPHARMIPGGFAGRAVLLKVSDTGTGIPEHTLVKIFDPFFTTKPEGKGTGLGLAVVLSIVKSHHGFINVQTEVNRGTTFEITVPASTSSDPQPQESLTPLVVEPGRGELVLVVDDEPSIRSVARQILTRHGYRARVADDGAHAVVLLAQIQDEVDLVLTDLAMPRLGGVALVRALQSMKPGLRIIASSGMDDDANAAELRALGVCQFLRKPYTTEQLLTAVREVLNC